MLKPNKIYIEKLKELIVEGVFTPDRAKHFNIHITSIWQFLKNNNIKDKKQIKRPVLKRKWYKVEL